MIEELDRLPAADDVVARFVQAIEPFGLHTVIFAGLPDEGLGEAVLGKNWPAPFFESYARENYVRVSPLVRRCRTSAAPFAWHRTDFDDEPDPRAVQVMRDAADCGMVSGFLVPIHSMKGCDACVSMAGERVELSPNAAKGLHLMAIYAFERLRSLRGTPTFASACRGKRALTPREREVLGWIAQGKTAVEVGEVLDIAKRTVDEHVQTAARKLGAKNRTHAVALALRAGSISL